MDARAAAVLDQYQARPRCPVCDTPLDQSFGQLLERSGAGVCRPCLAYASREHLCGSHDQGECWCEPELTYRNPKTGVTVWVHRSWS